MKYVPIMIMDNEFCLLSARKAKKILNKNSFETVDLDESYVIFIEARNLYQIRDTIGFHLLDESGTEMNNSDIEKILRESKPYDM